MAEKTVQAEILALARKQASDQAGNANMHGDLINELERQRKALVQLGYLQLGALGLVAWLIVKPKKW